MGNCGYTLAPVRADDQDYLIGLFAAAEEVPKRALETLRPVRLGDVPRVPGLVGGPRRAQRRDPGRAQRGAALRDGRSRARTCRHRGRDRRDGAARGSGASMPARPASAAARRRTSAVSSASTSRRSSPTAPRRRALADAVRRKGARLLSINPATKRDGLTDEDRAFLVELAEVSKAIVSWNDFGMGTPNGDSVLEFMEAQLQRGHRDPRHRAVSAPGDPLHAEEAVGAVRRATSRGRAIRISTRPPRSPRSAIPTGAPASASSGTRRSSW